MRMLSMLRYVRIEDDRRGGSKRNGLGAELKTEHHVWEDCETRDTRIATTLKAHFDTVDTWKIPFTSTTFNLRGIALFTAIIHSVLAILVIVGIGIDASNSSDNLKIATTKTVPAWVGANAAKQTTVTNFGLNPKDPLTNITLADHCVLAGDSSSKSASFNTRLMLVESYALDCRVMILFFFLLSFGFQLSGAFSADAYYEPIKRGNARRSHLVEYSVTASLMMMVMCLQVGVTDAHALANIFTTSWACMMFGLLCDVLVEHAPDKRMKFIVFGREMFSIRYSLLAHLAGWFTLLMSASAVISNMWTFNDCMRGIKIPDAVFFAVVSEAVMFALFGGVQIYTLIVKENEPMKPRPVRGTLVNNSAKPQNNEDITKWIGGMPNYVLLREGCVELFAKTSTASELSSVHKIVKLERMFMPSMSISDLRIQKSFMGASATDTTDTATSAVSGNTSALEALSKCLSGLEANMESTFNSAFDAYIACQQQRILVAYRAEFAYIMLSLTAKTVLGGLLYLSVVFKSS